MDDNGIRTWHELLDLGVPGSTISSRCAAGMYQRVLPGIYSTTELTANGKCRAISLWQKSAVLSHSTAAWLYGWTTEPGLYSITLPRSAKGRSPVSWLVIHRRDSIENSVVQPFSFRMTDTAQTLLDCVAVMDEFEAGKVVDSCSPTDRAAALELCASNPNRTGVKALRRHLRLASTGFASEPERVLDRALHALGLFLEINFGLGRYIADFVDLLSLVVIEVDGFEFHSDQAAMRRDSVRQNWIVNQGWFVLRFTAFDVMRDPDGVAAQIAEVVRRRRRAKR